MAAAEITSATSIVVGATLVLLGACAHDRQPEVSLPNGYDRLYVSVFVDEADGEMGGLLAERIAITLYNRSPERYSNSFERDVLAIDGTVTSRSDKSDDGQQVLVVDCSAVLRNKDGETVVNLGAHRQRVSFAVGNEKLARELAANRLAHAILEAISVARRA